MAFNDAQHRDPDRDRSPVEGSGGEIFHRSPLPMLLVDVRNRTILRGNEALATLMGYLPEELTGQPLDLLDTGSAGELAEWLLVALAAGDDTPKRRLLRGFDGSEIPVEVRATRLRRTAAPILALFIRDARGDEAVETERAKLEAQLWMAQKHEAVGRLAAGIAHDFSNLLSVVILTADSLRQELADRPSAQRELDVIADAGFRARELTAQLLAFSGRQPMDPRPISLNAVLGEMEDLLQRSLTEDVEVALSLCEGPAPVNADPTQLQQVLLNLAVNARDAMPDGGALVICTELVEVDEAMAREYASIEAGPHVLLTVSDTGMGMDEETRQRIFEPFFSTRDRQAGAGLGLATVYGIVKQTGGHIWVNSTPGAGTTFRIYLPRLEMAPRRSVGPRGFRVDGIPGGSEHILVVEDDEGVRTQTARILEQLGYTVTQTASPDDALLVHDDLWPRSGPHPIDLVLTDVIMPEMSGVELARRLRVKREDVPVVYMSGYLDPGAGGTRPEEGSPYLAKPFTREELAKSVRGALDALKG